MNITGTVRIAAKGIGKDANIHDAIVTLTVGGRELANLQTDRQGRFSYADESDYGGTTLICRVEKSGFHPSTKTLKINADTMHVDIHLESLRSPENPWWKQPWAIICGLILLVAIILVTLMGDSDKRDIRGREADFKQGTEYQKKTQGGKEYKEVDTKAKNLPKMERKDRQVK